MTFLTRILSLALLPLAVFADGFDYTYVEGGLVNTSIDGPVGIDGDGYGINGSFVVADNFHVLAGYSDQDYDLGLDGSLLNVGVGFNTGISENLDFVADLSYLDAEVGSPFGSADETGYDLGAGVRHRTRNNFELEGGLTYRDLGSSDTILRFAGRYYFSDTFAVGAGLADDDDGLSWNIGVRAEFGDR